MSSVAEALLKERDAAYAERDLHIRAAELMEQEIEKLRGVLEKIAAEASVPVRTKKKGGIKHKWMYRAWRKIAVDRIDIARAALKGDDHE